jgi:hypothetical protein
MESMHLGPGLAKDVKEFKLKVKNRRMKVTGGNEFEPIFKAKLAKLKADGDRMKPEDWFEREMWLSRDGSLVYYSVKEDRDLVYYTADDVAGATLDVVPDAQSARPFTFSVELTPCNDIAFEPGSFSAESEDMRQKWIAQFRQFAHKK